jgi:hypothetical protein
VIATAPAEVEGRRVGKTLGCNVGVRVTETPGLLSAVGVIVGNSDGVNVGKIVGANDGVRVGRSDGVSVGRYEG